MSIYYEESYSPFFVLKERKSICCNQDYPKGGGGKVRPNRPLIERVAIPQQIKTECPIEEVAWMTDQDITGDQKKQPKSDV